MKNLTIIITVILLSLWQNAMSYVSPTDTIVLKIDKRNQTLVGVGESKNISLKDALSSYLKTEGVELSDSLWNQIQSQIRSENDGIDIRADINGKSIKIAVKGLRNPNAPNPPMPPMPPMPPSLPEENAYEEPKQANVDFENGGIRIKDGEKDVYVGINGIHVKDGDEEVHIGKTPPDMTKEERRKRLFERKGFSLNLGLNGWQVGEDPRIFMAIYPPYSSPSDFDLIRMKSRYAALIGNSYFNIASGEKSALRLGYGIGVDFMNYRFYGNRVPQGSNSGVIFQPMMDRNGDEKELRKNKLGLAGIQAPVVLHMVFQRKSTIQMIGLGGYVNYGIRDWTKTKERRFEDKEKNNINLKRENFRYGLRAEIAFRHLPDFYFNYDLNHLIRKGYGPEISTFSFGILLF